MSDFLKKLYDTNHPLSLLLLEAKEIAERNDEKELVLYIDRETDGYEVEDNLPDYRVLKGEIVCDIKDVYGRIVEKEHPLNFKLLSDKVGFDLNDINFYDRISFIEISLTNSTKTTILRPVPKEVVMMLDEIFHFNNPNHHLQAAFYKLPKSTIEYIIARVRQNLIQAFQKMNRKNDGSNFVISDVKNDESKITNPTKKIFVTYAWENDDFNSLVISFVNFLRQQGFDASMDKKRSQEETAINFNQMMVEGISASDKIIVILTEKYKERADKFEGGIGFEYKIIMEDLKKNKNKYIFVSFGTVKREDITPMGMLGVDILDLKKDQDEHNFNNLFSKMKAENIVEFSDVSEETVEINKISIKPFKL